MTNPNADVLLAADLGRLARAWQTFEASAGGVIDLSTVGPAGVSARARQAFWNFIAALAVVTVDHRSDIAAVFLTHFGLDHRHVSALMRAARQYRALSDTPDHLPGEEQ